MRRKAQFMAKSIHAGDSRQFIFLIKIYAKQASEAGTLKFRMMGEERADRRRAPHGGRRLQSLPLSLTRTKSVPNTSRHALANDSQPTSD